MELFEEEANKILKRFLRSLMFVDAPRHIQAHIFSYRNIFQETFEKTQKL